MPVEPGTFRHVMRQLASGVVVITTRVDHGYHGLTANSFCAVGGRTSLVALCLDKLARGHDHVASSGRFTASILSRSQQFVADRFAGRAPAVNLRFDEVPHFVVGTCAPVLQGCLAWADCQVAEAHETGDHTLFLAEVLAAGELTPVAPLVYFRGRYLPLADA